MYYIAKASVEGFYSTEREERPGPLRVFLVVRSTEKKRYRDGARILGERITTEDTHTFQLRSPSPSGMKSIVLHAISLLRQPHISDAYATGLSDSASFQISHAIATGTKSFKLVVSIDVVDELQLSEESRDEEIPPQVLEESEELAQEHRFGGGSSSTAIEALKMGKYCIGDINESCTICIEQFLAGEDIAIMQCDHAYHKGCIDQWLMNNNSCPLCRVKQLKP